MSAFRAPLVNSGQGWHRDSLAEFPRISLPLTRDDRGDSVNLSDDEVRAAFAPVLRDVAATTDLRLTLARTADEAGPVVVVSTPTGGAWRVRIDGYPDVDARIEIATHEVQDLVIEELWRHGSNWPVCPKHPTTHPMELTWLSDAPSWMCPVDRTAVVALGSLTP